MSTVAWAVEQTRRHLMGPGRVELQRLGGDISDSATTVLLDSSLRLGSVAAGSVLSVDSELMYVWDASDSSATVLRGHMGTTAASHASGTVMEVNPRWPRSYIVDELLNEIRSFGPRLWRPVTVTYSVDADTSAVDVGASYSSFISVVDVRRSPVDSSWFPEQTWPRVRGVDVRRGLPTASFPSGAAVMFKGGLGYVGSLSITYAMPFTTTGFTEASDLVTDVGLAESMQDIPAIGAAMRLMRPREAVRTDTHAQGERRLAEEVPAGHISSVAKELRVARDARISEEETLLNSRWPVRF